MQDRSTLFSDSAMTTLASVDGPVGAHANKKSARHRIQTTAGNRPTLRQRSDGVYYLDYAGGKSLSVPSSTALFNYLHDGTGGSIIAQVEWPDGATTSNYIRTGSTTTSAGFRISKSTITQAAAYTIYRASSGTTTATPSIAKFALSSALHMMRFSYKYDGTASDGRSSIDGSIDTFSFATVNPPSSANGQVDFSVETTFNGKEYSLMLFNAVITDADARMLYAYHQRNNYPVANIDLTLLLGGQSNMSGRADVESVLVEQAQVGVYSYTKAEEFRLAAIPEHSIVNRPIATNPDEAGAGAPMHGFALRTGKKLNTDAGKKVLLVPCAIGGTSIGTWDTPLTANDRTTLFGAMVYRYQQASAKGGTPIIVWYGHEANSGNAVPDFTNGGVGSVYQNAFSGLMADVRAYTAPSAPIIFIQLASDDDLDVAEAHAATGEAQRQLELTIPNARMVVAHDLQRMPSGGDIHMARAGYDVLADRVSLAIRQHVLGEAVNGTGPRIVGATFTGSTVTLTCNKALNTTAGNYGSLFRVYANGVEQTVSSANRGSNTSTVEIVCSAPLTGPVTLTYGYRAGPASAARTDFVKDSDGLPLPLFGPVLVTP